MNTLLLRLVGPMQSWGVQSNFKDRDTGLEPSKSGVVGLLCAALGWERNKPIDRLANLTMGVRVDREGERLYDYHTAGREGFLRAKGPPIEKKDVIISTRWYLSDAAFLVGLGGDDLAWLQELHDALRNPHWPLYLGRKAFVPGEPVWLEDGLCPDQNLEMALRIYRRLRPPRDRNGDTRMRLILEDPTNGEMVRPDQPISFAERRFTLRRLRIAPPVKEVDICTSPA